MQLEDVKILMRVETQAWLTAHREHDPVQLALSNKSNVNLPPVVYSQLKIVQKAAVKLPSWVAANCIIPGRAYEQSSSERAAALKPWSGKRCLDLTSGLGVDAMHFARHFDEVIALEPDPVLAEVVRFNLQQFQVSNVKLEQSTAEAWLEQYEGQSFDLIYVDPDRRDEHGNRQQSPAKGKPDIRALIPKLMQIGKRLVIKASPLYDIAEAKRDFPEANFDAFLAGARAYVGKTNTKQGNAPNTSIADFTFLNEDNLEQVAKRSFFYSKEAPSTTVLEKLERIFKERLKLERLRNYGISTQEYAEMDNDYEINISTFDGIQNLKGINEIKAIIGGGFGYLIMMFIIKITNFISIQINKVSIGFEISKP